MPDDIKVLAATGDDTVAPPIATDLVGGKHYQKIKTGWGANDTWNEIDDLVGKRLPVAEPSMIAATPIDLGAEASTDEAIAAAVTGLRLIGFSARETTATAGAIFNIRTGTSNAGAVIIAVSLGANESAREWYGPDGIASPTGLWLERVSGTVQVTGYFKVVP